MQLLKEMTETEIAYCCLSNCHFILCLNHLEICGVS